MFSFASNQNDKWIVGITIYADNITDVGPIGYHARYSIGQTWRHLCKLNYMIFASDYVKVLNDSDIWQQKLGQ